MKTLIMIVLAILAGQANPGRNCWPLFRGDQALTGAVREQLPAKPRLLWSFQTGDDIKASPVACGDKIVVGSTDGHVYCLSLTGALIWKFNTGNAIEAPALILDGTVFVGNLSGSLHALNLADGKVKWQYLTEGQISGSPNWWKSGYQTRILVGSYDYYLHCIDAATGKGVWKYESDNFINGAASVVGNQAIFGGCDGHLHLVDITTGEAVAKIDVATYVPGSVPVSENLAVVGDYDGGVTCVDLIQKKNSWKHLNDKVQLPFIASAAIHAGKIVTGSRDKHVYCFNLKTGTLIWKFNTGEKVDASPVICGDAVVVANMRGDLIFLNLSDGKPTWTYETGSPITGNPAIIDGKIILGADDGRVYCFGKP
jgi:outer membrane protein assembly factor BamB